MVSGAMKAKLAAGMVSKRGTTCAFESFQELPSQVQQAF